VRKGLEWTWVVDTRRMLFS